MNPRVFLLALGTFALGTEGFVIAGVLPAISHDLSVSVALAGQLVTFFALTYALASPVLSTLTSRWERRRLLVASLIIFTVANVFAALAPTFGLLLLARLIAACGAAVYTPNASAVAVSLVPPARRGQALAIVTAGLTVSLVLGVPLGTWAGLHFSWRMAFVLVAVLGTIATVGVIRLLPNVPAGPTAGLRARLGLLKRPPILLALLLTTLWTTGGFTVYTYLSPLLQRITHLEADTISAMLLLFGVASATGNWLGGFGADRWGPLRVIAISLSLMAGALVALPVAGATVAGAAVTLFVWGVAAWLFAPSQAYRLLSLVPESGAIILSLNASAVYLGISLGAALGGLVLKFVSVAALGEVGGGFLLIGLGVLALSLYPLRSSFVGSLREG